MDGVPARAELRHAAVGARALVRLGWSLGERDALSLELGGLVAWRRHAGPDDALHALVRLAPTIAFVHAF
jgi:hypothetical protein